MNDEIQLIVKEFVELVDNSYGLFLDCMVGFEKNVLETEKQQQETLEMFRKEDPSRANQNEMDSLLSIFGSGDPNSPDNIILHRTTQGEFKARNKPTGRNLKTIGKYCLVLIYEYWDSEYRNRLSEVMGIDSKDIRIQVMGDLRLIRHAILHNKGRATKEMEKIKTLPKPEVGTEIFVNLEDMFFLTRTVKSALDDFVLEKTGIDPKHRTLWHVS